ncbi:MAG TPA: PAS domain S-box protein [Bacteroidales bacterium]|nr:PAS domain S-box protein [Bacteroidales bacterium]
MKFFLKKKKYSLAFLFSVKNRYDLFKNRLILQFSAFLLVISIFSNLFLYYSSSEIFRFISMPYLITSLIMLVIAFKTKNIRWISYSTLTLLLISVNFSFVLFGYSASAPAILWPLVIIIYAFLILDSKYRFYTAIAQLAFCSFIMFAQDRLFEVPYKYNPVPGFLYDISSLVPAFLIIYFIYYFIKIEKSLQDSLFLKNQQLLKRNQSLANLKNKIANDEKQFRVLTETTNDIVMICSPEGKIKYVSNSTCNTLKSSKEKLIKSNFADIVHPDDKELISAELDKLSIKQNIDKVVHFRINNEKGNIIWFEGILQSLSDTSGDVTQIHVVASDITEQKQQQSKSHILNQVLTQSNEGIILIDKEGKIIYSNKESSELYGFMLADMLHLSIFDLDESLNDINKWKKFFETLKNEKKINHDITFKRQGLVKIEMEERWEFHEVEGMEYAIRFLSNIDERKKNERKIRKNLEKQSLLSEISFILNTSDNFDYKINESLRIAGNFLKSSRVLLFQNILSGKAFSCTHEWYSPDLNPKRNEWQAIPYSMISNIHQKLMNKELVEIQLSNIQDNEILNIFHPDDFLKTVLNPIFVSTSMSGFIAIVDNNCATWNESDKQFFITFSTILQNTFKNHDAIQSLKMSERRFRELAELLPEMVCEASINGKITFANKQMQIQFGFNENDLSKGKIFFNLFTQVDKQRLLENFEKMLRSEHIENIEYTIVDREGNEIPVMVYINIIMKEHMPIGLRAVMVDISRRKNYERQLLSLAGITDDSPVAFMRVDRTGNVIYSNKQAETIKQFISDNYHSSFYDIFNSIYTKQSIEEMNLEIYNEQYWFSLYPDISSNYMTICARKKMQ